MAYKIGSDEREKSLYLIQIRHLDEQLERCQLKCDKLEKENKHLASQYSALEKDKKDITEYLKHTVAAKEKKVEELAESVGRQQRAAEQDREALQLQHGRQMQELREQTEELTSERRARVAKLEEQEEQLMELMQRMQQLPDVDALEKQLAWEMEEHEAAVHSLRMEALLEGERMAEESTADDCIRMKVSEIVLEERTEHREQLEEFQHLLNDTTSLLKEKQELKSSESLLCCEMNKMRRHLNKVTQAALTRRMETEQLTRKCQRLKVKLKERSVTHECTLAEEKALRERLASELEECRQKTAEMGQLGVEIQEEKSRRWRLEGDMQEAAIILRHILTETKETSETQWGMQRLLEVLESTAPQVPGSAPKDPAEKSSREQKPQTSGLKPAGRAETPNFATDPLFLLARYRPGDLGLVPRPTWKHKPQISTSTE